MISLDDLVGRIRRERTNTRVVAIDGPSGSGKSTLAARLAAKISGFVVVGTDDFASWSDPIGATWWDRFDAEVLVPAFAGRAFRYELRDWDNDEFGSALAGWREVPASPLVIVEGVTSARASVRARQAFTIWIEAAPDQRLARGVQRDGEDHRDLWLRWMDAEDRFFADDQTKVSADVRIDGEPTEPHDPSAEIVVI